MHIQWPYCFPKCKIFESGPGSLLLTRGFTTTHDFAHGARTSVSFGADWLLALKYICELPKYKIFAPALPDGVLN